MKPLLIRVGVLGTVAVLGCLAIAYAQRGDNSLRGDDSASADDGNPLRPASPVAARTTPAAERPAGPPSIDPFGLQPRRADASSSHYPAVRQVSAEQTSAGPALLPDSAAPPATKGYPAPPVGDRYASRPERATTRGNARSVASAATSDAHEPGRLPADPFAIPAAPTRAVRPDRSANPAAATSAVRSLDPPTNLEGAGQPGSQQIEGVQSPQLTIQKVAPNEIQVGKPAEFAVTVRNVGQAPASAVEIHDVVPRGTRLLDTTPNAALGSRGEVVWNIGTLAPGEERSVKMRLMPTAEGEIGSVATVLFGADASARTVSTRPQLKVETKVAKSEVLIGQEVTLAITVSNPGTGVATNVVIEERIPRGLQHPAGSELEYKLGDLKPGESRTLELALGAKQAGPVSNVLTARGDGNLHDESQVELSVLAPQLDVAMEGPKRRYLERQATYQVAVTNPGTAPAKQVELIATLPPGLKFVSANNAGYYEEASHTVRWRLEELPANVTGSVELVTMPVEAGEQAIQLRGTAQSGLDVRKEQPVSIEGLAAILFQVADSADPIEVGGETTYEIRVLNQGSKAAGNVRLTVDLPAEMKFVGAEGPTGFRNNGNRVEFDPLGQLAAKGETLYHVRAQAARPGDAIVSFQLQTDDMRPVRKEESTRVFSDE